MELDFKGDVVNVGVAAAAATNELRRLEDVHPDDRLMTPAALRAARFVTSILKQS
jgi:hypothetical protein